MPHNGGLEWRKEADHFLCLGYSSTLYGSLHWWCHIGSNGMASRLDLQLMVKRKFASLGIVQVAILDSQRQEESDVNPACRLHKRSQSAYKRKIVVLV